MTGLLTYFVEVFLVAFDDSFSEVVEIVGLDIGEERHIIFKNSGA